jgi:lysozyme family protein
MKRPATAVLLCASLLAGCSATARLYPVQGPLSQQNPAPVFVVRMGDGVHSGNINVVLDNGEAYKGRWTQVPRPNRPANVVISASPSYVSMASEWDMVYGQGFYVAHVLGARLYARAEITGNRGTVLHAELYKPDKIEQQDIASIKGVAKDDKGNIYKIAF